MKKIKWVVGFAALALVLTSCGQGETTSTSTEKEETAKVSQSITISSPAPISTLDTTQTTDKNTFTTVQQLFEGLMRFDEESQPIPGTAESVTVSEDGLVYDFKIREDAKWSNGEALTAKDFDYSWKRLVNPETQGPNAYLLDSVTNSQAIREGQKDIEEIGLEVTEDNHFIVTLDHAQPSFLSVVSIGWLAPQLESFVKEQGKEFATNSDTLVYNGPFVLADWDGTSDNWTLKKNDAYYDAKEVVLEEVAVQTLKEEVTGINLYESKELDLVRISGQYVAQYKEDPGYVTFNDVANSFIDFNQEKGSPLANLDLRRAIALAIDKESLADNVLNDGAKALNGLVPRNLYKHPETGEDFRAYSGDYLTHDLKKAKESFKKAQEALGDTITLSLLAADTEQGKKVAEYIQSQLEENLEGLSISVNQQPSNNVNQARRDKNYELSLSGWIAGSSELDSYFNLYASQSAYNYGNFNNKEYDTLVLDAKTKEANNPDEVFNKYQEAERIVLEENVAQVPVYQGASNYLVNEQIEGIEYPLYGGYFNLRNAELKQ